jgi:HEPN domain-containing protein
MPSEGAVGEAARWLRYAREDYEAAVALRSSGRPRHVCLLAQQSAEKAIKSIYAFLDLRIPRSHDLDMLRNLLPDGWKIGSHFEDLAGLSAWAVESRYPGDLPEASAEDADAAVALAGEVVSLAEQDLREHGYPM